MFIGAEKSVSASIAPCNIIGLMKHFSSSAAKEVSRKVLFSTSATIAVVIKKKNFILSRERRISKEKETFSQHGLNSSPNVSFKKRLILY